jgi:hypothetical protein
MRERQEKAFCSIVNYEDKLLKLSDVIDDCKEVRHRSRYWHARFLWRYSTRESKPDRSEGTAGLPGERLDGRFGASGDMYTWLSAQT